MKVLTVLLAVGISDLTTKLWAEAELGEPMALAGGTRLALSHNPGVAFGGLAGAPSGLVIGVVVASVAGLAWAMRHGLLTTGPTAAGLILGGAIANLIDRVEGGGVTDFVDLGAWPSFNVADAALTVGIVLLLWQNIRAPSAPVGLAR